MKPALSAIGAAILLGLLGYAFGRPLEIYEYVMVLFTVTMVVWTFEQYDHHRQH